MARSHWLIRWTVRNRGQDPALVVCPVCQRVNAVTRPLATTWQWRAHPPNSNLPNPAVKVLTRRRGHPHIASDATDWPQKTVRLVRDVGDAIVVRRLQFEAQPVFCARLECARLPCEPCVRVTFPYECVCQACVCACVRACMHACVHACVWMCTYLSVCVCEYVCTMWHALMHVRVSMHTNRRAIVAYDEGHDDSRCPGITVVGLDRGMCNRVYKVLPAPTAA